MITTSVSIGGGAVFWKLAEFTDHSSLEVGLDGLGLARFAPAKRTPVAVLKDSMAAIVQAKHVLLRPVADKDGWCAMLERKGKKVNEYTHLITCQVDDQDIISFTPYDARAVEIQAEFVRRRGWLHKTDVARALVAILDQLRATTLRPGGAFYWVEDRLLPRWQQVARVVEQAGISQSTIYLLRNVMDDDAIKAIMDGFIDEIDRVTNEIVREIHEDKLGTVALDNRRDQACELRDKIRQYEGILGVSLASLHGRVNAAEELACKAAILATSPAA